jgi:hypothetical protein
MSNPFKRASKTKPAATGGNYITDGDYDFLIENLVMREGGYKGDSFVAELRVERADRLEPDVQPNKVGSTVSYARVLKDDFNYQLMMALMYQVGVATGDDLDDMATEPEKGETESELEKWLKYACSKDQPCRGVRISARTYRTKTKKGDVITAVRWSAKEQDAEEIAANRAKLDG